MDRSQAAVLKAFLGNMQPCQSMYQGQTESEFFRLKKVLSIRLDSLRNVFHCFPSFPNPSGSPSVLSRWRVSPSLFFYLSIFLQPCLTLMLLIILSCRFPLSSLFCIPYTFLRCLPTLSHHLPFPPYSISALFLLSILPP